MANRTPPSISHSSGEAAAVVRERVTQNERNITALQGQLQEVFSTMATQEDVRTLTANISALGTKLDVMRTPQWQMISVVVTVVVLIGGLVYWPIREKQYDQSAIIQRHELEIVPRIEHTREWDRTERARDKLTKQIEELQRDMWSRK